MSATNPDLVFDVFKFLKNHPTLVLRQRNNSDSQKFRYHNKFIISVSTGLVVDIEGGVVAGRKIILYQSKFRCNFPSNWLFRQWQRCSS
jgi:hypothetical protein